MINTIFLALGAGDRVAGVKAAALAAIAWIPVWLAVAAALALGPGR